MTPRDRLAVLRAMFRDCPGPVTTGMVHTLYQTKGIAPHRTTAREDLKSLVREGLIYTTGPQDDRKFWLRSIGGDR